LNFQALDWYFSTFSIQTWPCCIQSTNQQIIDPMHVVDLLFLFVFDYPFLPPFFVEICSSVNELVALVA